MSGSDFSTLPSHLPAPKDDGAADHLRGLLVPPVPLERSDGGICNLLTLAAGRLVAYVYPRTGTPGEPLPAGWDDIPGARGCTPQSCAYRDAMAEFEQLCVRVVGISAQPIAEQREFAEREQIAFPLLNDSRLRLARALGLPTFKVEGMTLYRRLTLIAEREAIVKVFYPVFPPDRNASEVLAWLESA